MPAKRKKAAEEDVQQQRKTRKVNNNNNSNKKTNSKGEDNDTSRDDPGRSIVGGLKGGYRSTGDEANSEAGKSTFKVPFNDKQIICERRSHASKPNNENTKPELIFTHGAGGGISNPATASFADGFSKISPVVCFQGTMNLQSRVKTFHAVIEHEQSSTALGGRSMGARAAVITALESEEDSINGLVLVSYPLVGAGKGDVRDAILKDLGSDVDVLFVAGSEDSMCDVAHLKQVRKQMTAATWLVEVIGADHGMSLKSKRGVEPIRQETGMIAAEWLQGRDREKTYCSVEWDKESEKVTRGQWTAEEAGNTDQKTKAKEKTPARKSRE